MKYYKKITNGYISSVGKNCGGRTITENEYNTIIDTLSYRPNPPEGYDYRLREDLTWELYELPEPEPEEEEE